jgi:hypothetical protein
MTTPSKKRRRGKTRHVCAITTETIQELARRAPDALSVEGAIRVVLGMPPRNYYGKSIFQSIVKQLPDQAVPPTPEDGV